MASTPRRRQPAGWGALWLAVALNVAQVFVLDEVSGDDAVLVAAAGTGFLAELWLFARALRSLSVAVAYAVYGVTPAAVAVISLVMHDERVTVAKVFGLALIVGSVVALSLTRPAPARRERWRESSRETAGSRWEPSGQRCHWSGQTGSDLYGSGSARRGSESGQ